MGLESYYSFLVSALLQQLRTAIGLAVGAAATWAFSRIVRAIRFRRFRSVFGQRISSSDDFVISLPLWTLAENPEQAPRYIRRDSLNRASSHYGPSEMLAQADVVGASMLITLIARNFGHAPKLLSDRDAIALSGRTALIVGSPLVNYHGRDVRAMRGDKPLPLEFVRIPTPEAPEGTVPVIKPAQSDDVFRCTDSVDYGAVVRIRQPGTNRNSNYVFIVAGLTTAGTWAACRHLEANWRDLKDLRDEFGVLLKVSRASPQLAAEVVSLC